MYVRLFADTTGSAASEIALEYARSLMRLAPLRLVSVTGPLAGRWVSYGELMATPMLGAYVNCVACDPSRWVWTQRVPMFDRPLDMHGLKHGGELTVPAASEVASGKVELYTKGVRNVLFAIAQPRSENEFATACRYERIVVPASQQQAWWHKSSSRVDTVLLEVPVVGDGHTRMREIVGL